ncbi:BRCT domain protein [Reticulomyxa filosa]|uniref:BRCT domain protein n=1 Tax=Reticulomyxa filosa TaxID=46433 RepID=X6MKJ9_RETFI|nr:BRCT domain protein [Reticulomyxa filosa]|eukprot:ETO13972.1 BRCT domain protein [Reticulomyxa filosa]
MKTLNPVWNENTQFIFFKDPKELSFNVWDWDRGTKHDPIGECTVSLEGLFDNGHAGPIVLKKVKTGELFVTIKCRKLLPIELEMRATQLQNLEKQQQHTLAEQGKQMEVLTKQNNTLTEANQSLQESIGSLTTSKKILEDQASQLKTRKQELEEEQKKLSQARDVVQKEYEDLNNQCFFLQSTLQEEQDILSDLARENEELKSSLKKGTSELEEVTQEIAKFQQDIETSKQKEIQVSALASTDANDDEAKASAPLINAKANSAKDTNCQCCAVL